MITSIFITEENNYNDKLIYNKEENLLKIEWEGQNKTKKNDGDEFGVDSYIFYRKKKSKPFRYLGQVTKSKVIKNRTENNPIKKEFEIVKNVKLCNYTETDERIDKEKGYKNCGKYIRAAMRKLNLKIKNGSQFQGAYKHEPNNLIYFYFLIFLLFFIIFIIFLFC